MLETTEKGGFRNSIRNCLTVFQCDPLLSGAIAYNMLTDRNDIIKPLGYERSTGKAITDTDMRYIRLYLEETYGLTSEKKLIFCFQRPLSRRLPHAACCPPARESPCTARISPSCSPPNRHCARAIWSTPSPPPQRLRTSKPSHKRFVMPDRQSLKFVYWRTPCFILYSRWYNNNVIPFYLRKEQHT